MLSLKDFRKVSLEDKPVFDAHYAQYPVMHSDNMFTTMVSWQEYVDYRYVVVNGSLIIVTIKDKEVLFRPPLGKQNKSVLEDLLRLAKKEESAKAIVLIDTQTKTWMSQVCPSLSFIADPNMSDYVYRSEDLAELPGTTYGKIRNRLHKFQKSTTYTVESISKNNMDEVAEFLKRWCLWKDCASDELLENERKALLYSMDHFFELGLSALAIRISGNIEAISVFERMNRDTVVIHYEKGTPQYDGIYKAINQETAKIVRNDFLFIDRETDMGQPGLRKAKLSYHPDHMVDVWYVPRETITCV